MYKKITLTQRYLIIIIFIISILIQPTKNFTDITLLNCPSTYLKTKPKENQNAFVDFGSTLYAAYQTQKDKQSIQKIVIDGDSNQLNTYSTYLQIPYIVIAVIFIIIIFFIIAWCLFSRTCPPWQWTKRDPFTHPYHKKQMRFTLFWLIVFAVSILVIAVLLISEIPALKKNMDFTKCSIFVNVDTALYGGGKDGWTGFTALKDNVGNVSALISSTMTQIGLYFTGDDWLTDTMTIMKTKNNQLYSQNQDALYISPNPYKTATQLAAGFPAPKINSLFINKGLGPTGQPHRMTTQIQSELNTTEILSGQAYLIDRSTRLISDSIQSIQSNFIAAQNILSMYIHQLQNYITEMDSFSSTYFVQKFSKFLVAIQIIISACLIGTMLILIGAFSTSTFQILDCRKMVHIGWLIWSISFLGCMILLYFFLGLGNVSYQFCDYYDGILQGNNNIMAKIKSSNSQNAINRLGKCINGNGNSLESFTITQQIQTLNALFDNINIYDDYTNTSSPNFVNLTNSINMLSHWISNIKNYKKGVFIDANMSQTNEDNPNYSLDQLNLYSNTGSGGKTCSRDRWVFDRKNCTDSGEILYNTTDETNGGLLSTTQVTCISLNQGYSTSYNRIWNMQDFTKRYVQIRKNCPSAFDSITKFGKVLIDYRDSRINIFKGIEDGLDEILSINSDFNDLLDEFRSRVTQFSDSTKNMKNLLMSASKGIRYTSNCSIIGEKIKDTHTVYCRNFMSQIVRMGLCSLFLSVLILFGIWASSLFAVRYADIEKHERMNSPSEQTQSQRAISDKNDKKSQDSD